MKTKPTLERMQPPGVSTLLPMNLPEYITKDEVRRVCAAIGVRDWTKLAEAKVTLEEASAVMKLVGGEALAISREDFRDGLEVELEHGLTFPDANVTNNHPILTGRIVLAHLKETLDYYVRLRVAEVEGDMLKALRDQNAEKLMQKYGTWIGARADLAEREEANAQQKTAQALDEAPLRRPGHAERQEARAGNVLNDQPKPQRKTTKYED
jgi:Protein of unknown function (DUF5661)